MQLSFNANDFEPNDVFEAIPAGKYNAMIIESELKDTRDLTGKYLQLKFMITNGEHQNRTLFTRLNLQNKNPKAVEIANRELSSICRAIGVMQVNDSNQLHNIPMEINVKYVDARTVNGTTYDPTNEIKGYNKIVKNQTSSPTPWNN